MIKRRYVFGAGVLVAAGAVVLGLGVVGGSSPTNAGASSVTASAADSALVAKEASIVQIRTGVLPNSGDVYHTSREVASQVVDASSVGYDPSEAVTVVVFTGQFTDNSARIPKGAAAPTGTTITFVSDAGTGTGTDYGIGDAPQNLGTMGAPVAVPVQPSSSATSQSSS
jgi:hypothetical protein